MQSSLVANKNGILKKAAYSVGKLVAIRPGNLLEGIETCRYLHRHAIASTLGKFSRSGEQPFRIAREYQEAGSSLKTDPVNELFYLSVKPPALEFNLELATCIATTAIENGHGINFDSHDHALAGPTIHLLEKLVDRTASVKGARVGWRYCLTLPSRWKRSLDDAAWVASKGIRARLVKGEFKARRSRDEMDPVKGFLELTNRLAGKIPEIAVATHDYELARQAIGRIKKTGSAVQLELIFGMPATGMIRLSKQLDIPVRFYVPYGDTLFVYGVRQFLTNPHKLLRPNLLEVFSHHQSKLSRIVCSMAAAAS